MSSVDDGGAARASIRHQLTATARMKLHRAGLPLHLSPLGARGLRNLLFSSGRYLARPTLNLVATPILLSYLGVTQYGLWMTVSAILGVGAIADFGILDSTVRYVSKYSSLGDEPAVVRTIRSAASVCAIVGLVGVGILAAGASFTASHLLHIPPVEQHFAAAAIRLSGFYFLFGFINAGLRSALRGCHRYDLDAKLDIAFEVVTTLTNVALAYGGAGLLAVLTNMILWSLVATCATAVTLRRTAVKSLVFWPLLSPGVIGETSGYATFIWWQGICTMALANFDRLLIASQLGPNALAYYAVSLQLAQQVHAFLSNALAFLFPTFSEVKEIGSSARLRKLYRSTFSGTLAAALVIAVPLYAFAPAILSLWLGEHVASVTEVSARMLVCYYLITTMLIIPHYFLNGIGNSRLNAIFLASAASVSIAMALILLPRFGAQGAALSRLAIAPVCIVLWAVLHRRLRLSVAWTLLPAGIASLAVLAALSAMW